MSRGGEQIKVSQVAGLIDQIQAGGSEDFKFIKNVSIAGESINKSCTYFTNTTGDGNFSGEFKFTPKEDNIKLVFSYSSNMTNDHSLYQNQFENLIKDEEYTFTFKGSTTNVMFVFVNGDFTAPYPTHSKSAQDIDVINFCFITEQLRIEEKNGKNNYRVSGTLRPIQKRYSRCPQLKDRGGGIEKTLKISEVAEKINSIEVGGGSDSSFKYIENVTFAGESISSSIIYNLWTMGDTYLSGTLQFTPKEENVKLYYCCQNSSYLTGDGVYAESWNSLTKGKAYTITFNKIDLPCFFVFTKEELFTREKRENFDVICITTLS